MGGDNACFCLPPSSLAPGVWRDRCACGWWLASTQGVPGSSMHTADNRYESTSKTFKARGRTRVNLGGLTKSSHRIALSLSVAQTFGLEGRANSSENLPTVPDSS